MKGLIEGAGYKYLGILQADQIRYTEMKEKVKAEYPRRVHNQRDKHMGSISPEVLCSIHRLELCRIDTARSKNYIVNDNA